MRTAPLLPESWSLTLVVTALSVSLAGPPVRAQTPEVDSFRSSQKLWAQGVPIEDRRRAHKLFLAGTRLLKDGLFRDAAVKYSEALALWSHPAIHYNMAIAQLNLDQPIAAYMSLQKAMHYGSTVIGADKYEHARNYRTILDKQLARIEVICSEPDATITLDGTLLFAGPGREQTILRPGGHQLVAAKPGYLTETIPIVLSPGDSLRVDIILVPYADIGKTRRWSAWKPWAAVGVGAAVALAGGILHWRASDYFVGFDSEFDRDCPRGCADALLPGHVGRRLDVARGYQTAAFSAYVAGGLTVTTGLIMAYLNRAKLTHRGRAPTPRRGQTDRLSLVPPAWARHAVLSARMHF